MFPVLTPIDSTIASKIKNTSLEEYSNLNCFVRVISGTADGLIMVSNPNINLFVAAGVSNPSIYGNKDRSGTIGFNWKGAPVNVSDIKTIDVPFKPSPIVTSINAKEGKDQISRHCDLKFTAFTLGQVELLQKYFMEPGHSVVIEWGWNTPSGVGGCLPIDNNLVNTVGERNLNQDNLLSHRIKCDGEYESFFGFIVGGAVSSNGDVFDVSIKLRGAPGLPTWMQSQFNVSKIENGKIQNNDAVSPFGIPQLNLIEQNQMAERRFKWMFNLLPKPRQTKQVVGLMGVKGDSWSNLDFVNFDPVIENEISIWRDGRLAQIFGGSTSGTSALGSIAGNNSTAAAINANQSGQTNAALGPAAPKAGGAAAGLTGGTLATGTKDAKRTDKEFLEWAKYYNIANKIESIQNKNNTSNSQYAWKSSSTWTGYRDLYKLTDADGDKAIELRLLLNSSSTIQGTAAITVYEYWYEQNPKAPGVPPAPAPTTPPNAPAVVGQQGGFTAAPSSIGPSEIMLAGGLPIPKEKLFSKNKYIRFGKAVQLLNANSELKSLTVAGKNINVIIDIRKQPIGAFKGIYSTKPESLLIPGLLPDFSRFFMEQNVAEDLELKRLVSNPIGVSSEDGISFAQGFDLDDGKFSEAAYKWGYLENLYINFDLFCNELAKPNRTMRECLESMLNEMSLAVNSFWNFQVLEKNSKEKTGGNSTVYTVVDENWVGKQKAKPAEFIHSGEKSRFLQADLTIDIPGAMTNKIVAQRLSLSTNPDQKTVALGGVFTSSTDNFFKSYTKVGSASPESPKKEEKTTQTKIGDDKAGEQEKKLEKIDKKILTPEQEAQKQDIAARERANNQAIEDLEGQKQKIAALKKQQNAFKSLKDGVTDDSFFFIETDDPQKAAYYQKRVDEIQKQIDAEQKSLDANALNTTQTSDALKAEAAQFEQNAAQQAASNVSNNLDKIDVVPNPAINTMTQTDLNAFINDINVFKSKFRVYCCKDQKFLNVLKENNLPVSVSKPTGVSQPLPIKYSFTILGRSGLRRGDTFTVVGIPEKYSMNGFFQITQIEHTVQDMKWTTKVEGSYRQIQ